LIERYVLATQTTGGSDYGTRKRKKVSREESVDELKSEAEKGGGKQKIRKECGRRIGREDAVVGTGPHLGLVQLRRPFLYWTGQVRAQVESGS
jgi:hypothetical protein